MTKYVTNERDEVLKLLPLIREALTISKDVKIEIVHDGLRLVMVADMCKLITMLQQRPRLR
jgi:hypothetical protein